MMACPSQKHKSFFAVTGIRDEVMYKFIDIAANLHERWLPGSGAKLPNLPFNI